MPEDTALFTCGPAVAGVTPAPWPRGAPAHRRHPLPCAVARQPTTSARPHFKPEFEPFMQFSSEATREVNRTQIASLRER